MYYAGIGSRQTPDHILELMAELARYLAGKGWILRSGGAAGADQAFEHAAGGGEIFTAHGFIPAWTRIFTEYFHPNPSALTPYARRLMDRNAMQILGMEGDFPVEFVVCWTKDGKKVGGTAQAIRIAEFYHIPIYNLAIDGELDRLYEYCKDK